MNKQHNYPYFFKVSSVIHNFISRYKLLSKYYLALIGFIMRSTGNFPLKDNIINNVSSFKWPKNKFGPVDVTLSDNFKVKLIPHTGEFEFLGLFKRELQYEKGVFQLINKNIHKYDAIIEIGANIGIFSIYMAKKLMCMNKNVPVYSFEPSREAYSRLLENINNNNLTNIFPFNLAIYNKEGFLTFYEPVNHLTNGSVHEEFANIFSSEVKNTTVASFSANELEQLIKNKKNILFKIDVEGAEAAILKNIEIIIIDKAPDIILEVLNKYEDDLNSIQFIREKYDYFLITDEGIKKQEKFKSDPLFRDYLLTPKS